MNIRVNHFTENASEKGRFCLDIKNNTVAGIYGEGKHTFISLLSGHQSFEGDIVLDSISLKGDYDEYLNQIAVLTKDSAINTDLSVNDFLDFFGSMGHAFDEDYEERKYRLLERFELQKYIHIGINHLREKECKLVKLISLFLQERSLVLLDTFLESFEKTERNQIICFLKEYARKEKIILISSDDYQLLQSFSETIYIVD